MWSQTNTHYFVTFNFLNSIKVVACVTMNNVDTFLKR